MTESAVWHLLSSRHRIALTAAVISCLIVLLGALLVGLVQNPAFVEARPIKAMPVVPIFAVVNEGDGHLVFVNEQDLGYQAENLFPLPADQPRANPDIRTEESEPIKLRQPDPYHPREMSRSEISLSIDDVRSALSEGRDYARINNYHEKRVIELSSGEPAVWIEVPHFRRYLRYSSGLVYAVRNGRPVILYQMSATHDFELRDFDGDGFLDIGRVIDKSFAWTHWEFYRFDAQQGYFTRAPARWHWFPLKYGVQEIKVLIALAFPLLLAVVIAGWLRRHWFSILLNIFVQIYLLLVVLAIAMIATLNYFPVIWVVAMTVLLMALMRLARSLVKKPQEPSG